MLCGHCWPCSVGRVPCGTRVCSSGLYAPAVQLARQRKAAHILILGPSNRGLLLQAAGSSVKAGVDTASVGLEYAKSVRHLCSLWLG